MLNPRYANDGVALLKLNELQRAMKSQIEQKVAAGAYRFEKIPCCGCDGSDFELLAEKDRYGLYMPVVICRGCGLIQTNPRMNEEAYREFYNAEYRKLYVGTEQATIDFFKAQYESGKRIYDYVVRNGAVLRPGSLVMEIGCGAGGILAAFRDQGCDVIGGDWGEEYIEFGRKTYGLNLLKGGLRDIKSTLNRPPDLVIYSHVFEHMLNAKAELEDIHSVCGPTSSVYFEVPGVKELLRSPSYQGDFLVMLQNAHTYHFTLATLTNVVEAAGFKRAAGDEFVRSLFKKSEASARRSAPSSDYAAAMSYLKKAELLRVFCPYTRNGLAQAPFLFGSAVLRKMSRSVSRLRDRVSAR